ncbi:hypothetical protein [Paenibacillus sp. SI8]|uniref:hypothetical protein n=1 Tax=unclassified Paenibacillus TaxID=185978 RepID=UPI003465D17B
MNLFVILLEEIEDRERSWIETKSVHIARIASLACLGLLIYMFTFLIPFIIGEVLGRFIVISGEFRYLWAISLLLLLPMSIPLIVNWTNRRFVYSTIVVDFFESLLFSKINIGGSRTLLEIFIFITYIVGNMLLSLFAVANFINEEQLVSIIEYNKTTTFSIMIIIHTVIYISIRVLLLQDKTLEQKLIKSVREFRLWLLVFLITVAYMIYKLAISFTSVDAFYLIGAILVAFVRLLSSYKELRRNIVEFKETVAALH